MLAGLSREDLALLVRAAHVAGLDPCRLRAANPWRFEGPVAVRLQRALVQLDPAAAERLRATAGVKLSLSASAALAGLQPWTPALEREVAAAKLSRVPAATR